MVTVSSMSVCGVEHFEHVKIPTYVMTLTRRYDGEPIVRVELDTSVELGAAGDGGADRGDGAEVARWNAPGPARSRGRGRLSDEVI